MLPYATLHTSRQDSAVKIYAVFREDFDLFWRMNSPKPAIATSVYMYGELGRYCETLFRLPTDGSKVIPGIQNYLAMFECCDNSDDKLEMLFYISDLIRKKFDMMLQFEVPYDIREISYELLALEYLPHFSIPASCMHFLIQGDEVCPCELVFSFDPILSPICPSTYLETYQVNVDDNVGFRNSILDILKVRHGDVHKCRFFSKGLNYLYQ